MKNLKVSQKLIVGFLIVSLLTAAVGLIGTTNIRKISENEADLYAHHTIPTGILVQLTTDAYTLRLYVAKAALSKSPEEWQPAIEAIGKIRAKIEEDMQQYFQAIGKDDPKAQAIGKEFESKYKEYFTYVDQEISYLNQGNTSAVAEMVKPTAPFSKTGAALGEIAGKMREELVAGAKAASDQNMQQAKQIILIMRIIMAIAVVLAMLIGLYISRLISKPINMIKEAADNLAQGDLDIQLNYQSKDEAGQVVKSFERVIGNIKELITESQILRDAAIEGNLDKRGNAALFDGSFKELIDGTNAIMDTLTGHIDTIPSPIVLIDEQYNLKYANAMAAKLVNKTQSELIGHKCFDELCSSVCNNDQCPGRTSFAQGIKAQSEAKAGPMDVSVSTVPFKDLNGKIIGIIEIATDQTETKAAQRESEKQMEIAQKLANYQAKEVDKLIENLDKMAQGQLDLDVSVVDSDEDTKEVADNFIKISNSLEASAGIIKELVTESQILKDAAIEGSLDKRGNAALFEGSFKELINGINAIMDTLTGHIDTIPSPIVLIDKQYNLKYANAMAAKLVNKKQSELVGHKCFDELCSSVCNNDQCPGRISFGQGMKAQSEAKAGPMDVSISTVPFKDMDGNIIGLIEIAIDQTETKAAQRESEKQMKIAQKQAGYQANEVEKLIQNLENLAQGQLHVVTSVADSDEDTKEVANNFIKINNSLEASTSIIKSYIEELSGVLSQIADKNLAVGIEREYLGDFIELKDSINLIVGQLNIVLAEINDAAEQVGTGANQVAASSQNLAQGASEQASSIEEISATVTDVTKQTKENAMNANKANELSVKAKMDAQNGNEQMISMLSAMNDVKESSKNIGSVIKVIDDIAFQTNILALNAAVEAARAGAHGKGFAVVAEEVRNLAARSAKAAQETTGMIDSSIRKVEESHKIANETAEALTKIVGGVSDAVEIVSMISDASVQQATAITQIDIGINQISHVTQTNTATAEESASASEEMAAQAQVLTGLIREFKLKNTGNKSIRKLEAPKNLSQNPEISLDDNSFGKY